MKNLTQHIQEKLRISGNTTQTKHTLFPKTREELEKMIDSEIEKNGNKCSLNHIDVSKITDMSSLFYQSKFDGDISGWNVSNVEKMDAMFMASEFTGENGDISDWDVSNVTDMWGMFTRSKFNGNIDDWDVSSISSMASNTFWDSPLEKNVPEWFKKYL
jgi:hypothetical protein